MYQARQCSSCDKWGTWRTEDPVCPDCTRRSAEVFEREWRRVAHYLAFNQWLFDHGRLNDKEAS